MKRYTSIYELAAELDAQGLIRDRDIAIPADSDPEEAFLSCDDGTLSSYPSYNAYYIHPKNNV